MARQWAHWHITLAALGSTMIQSEKQNQQWPTGGHIGFIPCEQLLIFSPALKHFGPPPDG